MATKNKKRVVIIGAGFGGLAVAKGLGNSHLEVTVIDRNNYHLFQPLLYQVATASLSPAEIASPIRSILSNFKNIDVLLGEVNGIDKEKSEVMLVEGARVPYDTLVVATGARHGYFGHEEWEKFAPGLKSIEDATNIRRQILLAFEKAEIETSPEKQKELLTFVIIGAGPTGVELAGALAELAHRAMAFDFRHFNPESAKIILIEAQNRILGAFPEELAKTAHQALESLGVEVKTQTLVKDINQRGVQLLTEFIATQSIIWAAGVMPTPVGQWLNTEVDSVGRVKVTKDLSIVNYPNIFVIGDVSTVLDNKGKALPGLAPVARQQGEHVVEILLEGKRKAFQYRNKGNLAIIGRSFAIADFGFKKLSGYLAWLVWLFVHIMYLVGFKNRVLVFFQWSFAFFTRQSSSRLITTYKSK